MSGVGTTFSSTSSQTSLEHVWEEVAEDGAAKNLKTKGDPNNVKFSFNFI